MPSSPNLKRNCTALSLQSAESKELARYLLAMLGGGNTWPILMGQMKLNDKTPIGFQGAGFSF